MYSPTAAITIRRIASRPHHPGRVGSPRRASTQRRARRPGGSHSPAEQWRSTPWSSARASTSGRSCRRSFSCGADFLFLRFRCVLFLVFLLVFLFLLFLLFSRFRFVFLAICFGLLFPLSLDSIGGFGLGFSISILERIGRIESGQILVSANPLQFGLCFGSHVSCRWRGCCCCCCST